jgi:hypothetical protein
VTSEREVVEIGFRPEQLSEISDKPITIAKTLGSVYQHFNIAA